MHALEAPYRRSGCRVQRAQGFDVRHQNGDIRRRPSWLASAMSATGSSPKRLSQSGILPPASVSGSGLVSRTRLRSRSTTAGRCRPRRLTRARRCRLANSATSCSPTKRFSSFRRSLGGSVGAGPLGLELAQARQVEGPDRGVRPGDHLAALRDADVAKELRSVLGKEFPIHLGVKLDVEKDGQGARFSWSGPSLGAASFERVLVAAGPPAPHDLNLATTGLRTNERGVPNFDPSTLQRGDAPIFLAGDVDAHPPAVPSSVNGVERY
jgi:hypothetical protein